MSRSTQGNTAGPTRHETAAAPAAVSCCGGPATNRDACCLQDERVKDAGGPGCRCQTPSASPAKTGCC
jgi:hypothetical protein